MAAEQAAMELCAPGGCIYHLLVVPDLWRGMTGDDWLNNGVTRDVFRRYLEGELGREVEVHCNRINQAADSRGLMCQSEIRLGEPMRCLIDFSKEKSCNLVIMGSPRPAGMPGLSSRIRSDKLIPKLGVPLLVVPHPAQ